MIIQHPDGSYEECPLPRAAARWLRALLRQRYTARPALAGECAAAMEPGCEQGQDQGGAACGAME